VILRSSVPRSPNLLVRCVGPGAIPVPRAADVDVIDMHWKEDHCRAGLHESTADHIALLPQSGLRKFGMVHVLFGFAWPCWQHYERVAFWDDDLSPMRPISRFFDAFRQVCEGYLVRVAHPGLTRDSHYAHECSLSSVAGQVGDLWQRVPFCELMAPMFTRAALRDYLPTFGETEHGYGLEQVWAHKEAAAGRVIARIDATPVRHARPIGESYDAERAMRDGVRLMRRHGVPIPSHVPAGYLEEAT
jgi:hypothetical protein